MAVARSAPSRTGTRRPPPPRPRPAPSRQTSSAALRPVELRLLGGFDLRRGGVPCPRIESRRARALLAYLALARGQSFARDRLAGLLWPGHGDASAHQNLRQTLYNLHAALGDRARRIVTSTTLEVGIPAAAPLWLDVAELEAALDRHRHGAEPSQADLESALRLYRGDLLAGLSLGTEEFDDWLEAERERLRELAAGALLALLASCQAAGSAEEEIRYGRRLLEIDPLCEAAHLHLVAGLARTGRRGGALAHFERLRRQLDEELGLEPSPQALALERTIQMGELGGARSGEPVQAAPGDLVIPFVGRQEAWKALERTWEEVRRGRARLTAVTGPPGKGRTRLALTFLDRRCAADGAIVLFGRAAAQGWAGRFEPLLAALASLPAEERACSLGDLALRLPGLCGCRADLPCPSPPPPISEPEAARAVAQLLASLASGGEGTRPRPVAILLDDADHGDPALRPFLATLVAQLDELPIWLLATAEDARLRAGPASTPPSAIRLAPLSVRETRELAASILGEAASGPLAEALQAASRGLPLAVAEGLNLLADSGALVPAAEQGWRLTRPAAGVLGAASLEELLARRVGLLPTESRRLLTLAAIAGDPFSADLLQAADGEDPRIVAAALDILLERRFVRPWLAAWLPARREHDRALWAQGLGHGRFEISHPTLRRHLCARLIPGRRRALHRQVAAALLAGGDTTTPQAVARLAYHLFEARDWERALPLLHQAEEWARATGDRAGAERFAARARRARDLFAHRR